MTCKWLPGLLDYPDWGNYDIYELELYEIFRALYVTKKKKFKSIKLQFRKHPLFKGKEESFYHMTCKGDSFDERLPDPERIIRIKWPDAFFDNYVCNELCCQTKPKYWVKKYKGKNRHKILHKNYIVILEERDSYFLFITAFYITQKYYLKGLEKEYNRQKTLSF